MRGGHLAAGLVPSDLASLLKGLSASPQGLSVLQELRVRHVQIPAAGIRAVYPHGSLDRDLPGRWLHGEALEATPVLP